MQELDLGRVLDLFGDELPKNFICRHECCKRPELHGYHELRRTPGAGYRTRSERHADHPWKAQYAGILREAVYAAVSIVEPRNFQMIVNEVRNDYGSCLDRSVYRHLRTLIDDGSIIRLSWKRLHAYLRPNSKLLGDPALVYDQIAALAGIG